MKHVRCSDNTCVRNASIGTCTLISFLRYIATYLAPYVCLCIVENTHHFPVFCIPLHSVKSPYCLYCFHSAGPESDVVNGEWINIQDF